MMFTEFFAESIFVSTKFASTAASSISSSRSMSAFTGIR
jgi:hypothetical protein